MAEKNDIKTGFKKYKKGKKMVSSNGETPKIHTPPLQEQKIVKPINKAGRPTYKDPNEEHVVIGGLIRKGLKEKMQIALLTNFKDKHKTQIEFIEAAIEYYLNNALK